MTILWNHDRLSHLGSGIGIELKPAARISYDENPTPIQELIERQVTNGRGYLGLRDALDVVNRNPYAHRVTFMDALDKGLVPIYLTGPRNFDINPTNPCNEIPLGKSSDLPLLRNLPEPTLLEQVETIQHVKSINPAGCFSNNPLIRRFPYICSSPSLLFNPR